MFKYQDTEHFLLLKETKSSKYLKNEGLETPAKKLNIIQKSHYHLISYSHSMIDSFRAFICHTS